MLKYIVVIFLCCTVALLVWLKPSGTIQVKKQSLASALSRIKGWQLTGTIPLSEKITSSLALDDYLFGTYRNGPMEVGLYIGYYLTTDKVGAAHDPLVCLPGQGWLIKQRGRGKLNPEDGSGRTLSYSTMMVERNGEQELFLYWFQAYDKAASGTFTQKLASLTNKVHGFGQDNAFVRLSCSMTGRTEQQCMQIFSEFTRDFYPAFLRYIKSGI